MKNSLHSARRAAVFTLILALCLTWGAAAQQTHRRGAPQLSPEKVEAAWTLQVRGVCKELEIPEENIHVITPFVGGGFGGKKSGQQISEAVRLSKITGHPVQLAWTRREEFFYDACWKCYFGFVANRIIVKEKHIQP